MADPPLSAGARPLDFIVVGAQKSGTTTLWQLLKTHPGIGLPEGKEALFFTRPDADDPAAFAAFVADYFADAPPDVRIGTVTPHYMMGNGEVSAETIAARIARVLPDVRIVALLRDPVERAISHYRMSVRRGFEARSFEQAARELLEPERLNAARVRPDETNSYLVQGEYGRILDAYRRALPPEQLCVLLTRDLEQHPAETLDRMLTFLGLPQGFRPEDLHTRHHRGGSRARLDPAARAELLGFLDRHVFPACSVRERDAFNFFFETWNVIADDDRPPISPQLRDALDAHFTRDAGRLRALGIEVPWVGGGC